MGLNLDYMRRMVRIPLGVSSQTQLSDTDIDVYLNRAYWEYQNKFPFREKEVISTFDTVAGQRSYDVSFPTEAVKHIAITEVTTGMGQHIPLTQITRDVYEQQYQDDSSQQAMPVEYVREGCIIRLWPTPDQIYTLTIERLVALTDLSTINNLPVIPQVWHEIIGYGGLWRAYIDFGDLQRSNFIKSMQAELINTIVPTEVNESQSNSQRAGVSVLGLGYDQNDSEFWNWKN